jgi:hypothetical protein
MVSMPSDHQIRVDVAERLLAEQLAHVAPYPRYARRAAHQDHTVERGGIHPGVAQRAPARAAGAIEQRLDQLVEVIAAETIFDASPTLPRQLHTNLVGFGQPVFGLSRGIEREPDELRGPVLDAHRHQHFLGDQAIHVVAAERGVAARALDLEHTVFEREDGDVEGAAAQIVHGEQAISFLVQAVRERRGRRLVEQAEDVEPGEPARVLGGLPLCIVEVRRHRDDGPAHGAELIERALSQALQDLRADLDRRDRAAHVEAHDLGLLGRLRSDERVRAEPGRLDIVGAAAHEALDAGDGLFRVNGGVRLRAGTHHDVPVLAVMDDAGQERRAVTGRERERSAVANRGDDAVGRPEVDADGLRWRFGIEDVEQHHQSISSSSAAASSRKRR